MPFNIDWAQIGIWLIQGSIAYLFGVLSTLATESAIWKIETYTAKRAGRQPVRRVQLDDPFDFFHWITAPLALLLSFGLVALVSGSPQIAGEISILVGFVIGIFWH